MRKSRRVTLNHERCKARLLRCNGPRNASHAARPSRRRRSPDGCPGFWFIVTPSEPRKGKCAVGRCPVREPVQRREMPLLEHLREPVDVELLRGRKTTAHDPGADLGVCCEPAYT